MLVHFFLQHQQQVASAVDRAKQVTMTELNAIIGVSIYGNIFSIFQTVITGYGSLHFPAINVQMSYRMSCLSVIGKIISFQVRFVSVVYCKRMVSEYESVYEIKMYQMLPSSSGKVQEIESWRNGDCEIVTRFFPTGDGLNYLKHFCICKLYFCKIHSINI